MDNNFLAEFLSATEIYSKNKNCNLYYRGQSDKSFKLQPSLGRCKKYLNREKKLIQRAKNEHPNIFLDNMRNIDLLARMQHYGYPTRLLDITLCPLVALYFACCSQDDKDAVVYVFKIKKKKHSEKEAKILGKTHKNTRKLAKVERNYEAPIFIEPVHTLLRQESQNGAYLVFANDYCSKKQHGNTKIKKLSKNNQMIVCKIHIKSNYKHEILQELKEIGITKSYLFPEKPVKLFDCT